MKNNIIEKLAAETSFPCITISYNTHRTHPDNLVDSIELKNLLKEAKEKVIAEYSNKDIKLVLEKLDSIENEIEENYSLDSLHIFISAKTKIIVKSPWKVDKNTIQIAEHFAIKPLIKILNSTQEYLILLLSQSGVKLYHAINDMIVEEIKNSSFPFSIDPHFLVDHDSLSYNQSIANLQNVFFKNIDKFLIKYSKDSNLKFIVVSTEDNFNKIKSVSENPDIYLGYSKIVNNDSSKNTLAKESWEIIQELQKQSKIDAIAEIQNDRGNGLVIENIHGIYKDAKEGKGEVLILNQNYIQPVLMKDELTFDLIKDLTTPNAIEDITNEIAWEVISHKGKVIFTDEDDNNSFNNITMKLRYI